MGRLPARSREPRAGFPADQGHRRPRRARPPQRRSGAYGGDRHPSGGVHDRAPRILPRRRDADRQLVRDAALRTGDDDACRRAGGSDRVERRGGARGHGDADCAQLRGPGAWAPGPVVVRPVYAPALVAFFGGPSVHVAIGVPGVSWVALGWGEPLVPWWGRPQFVGRPTWVGWGGPRFVNNVVVNRTTVVNVTNINDYRNTNVTNAVV